MDAAKLGRILIGIGVAGLIGSFLWWLIFFARVNKAFGGKASDLGNALQCLVSNSGPCGFITGIAGAAGEFAYQPAFFWISAVVLVVGLVVAGSAGPTASGAPPARAGAPYDADKWNALTELDPEIAAAVAQVKPYGSLAVNELATKYLTLNDKQYLAAIVKQIAEKYSAALAVQLEGQQWDELGRKVDMVWRTPWGTIARLHDDTALVIRPEGYEILPSLGEFHRRYRGQSQSWVEISDIEEKRHFFREARLVLQELNSR
jgi:hypothetical protein